MAIGIALALQVVPPFGSAQAATPVQTPAAATVLAAAPPVTGVDLQVSLTGPAKAVPGSTITDSILISNGGTQAATGVAFDLSAPATGATYVIDPAVATCDTTTWHCTLAADLLPSGQVSVALQVQTADPLVDGSTVHTIVHVSTTATDVDPSNDTDDVTTVLTDSGQLAVTIQRTSTGAILPGQKLGYHVTLKNTGPNVAQAPKLYLFPPESPYSSDTSAKGAGASCSRFQTSGAWVCSWPSLPAGQSRVVSVLATASTHLAEGSSFVLFAGGRAANSLDTEQSDVAPVTDTTKRAVDMAVTTYMTPTVKAGKKGHWKITVANRGKYRAHDVVLTSTLPDGFTWTGFDGKSGGKGTSRTKSVKLGDIEAGTTLSQSGTFSYPAGTTLIWHMSLSQADPDAKKSNNVSESRSHVTGLVVTTKKNKSSDTVVNATKTDTTTTTTVTGALYDDSGQVVSSGTTTTTTNADGTKTVLADTGGPALRLPLMGFTLVLLGAVSSLSSRRRRPAPRHRAFISTYA